MGTVFFIYIYIQTLWGWTIKQHIVMFGAPFCKTRPRLKISNIAIALISIYCDFSLFVYKILMILQNSILHRSWSWEWRIHWQEENIKFRDYFLFQNTWYSAWPFDVTFMITNDSAHQIKSKIYQTDLDVFWIGGWNILSASLILIKSISTAPNNCDIFVMLIHFHRSNIQLPNNSSTHNWYCKLMNVAHKFLHKRCHYAHLREETF